MSNARKTLVIGIGNPLRGDDGVGPMIANQIAWQQLPGVEAITVHQLVPELAEKLSQFPIVILIDALQCTNLDAPVLRRIAGEAPASQFSHQLSPTQLLEMAKTVSGRAPDAWLLTVPVSHLDVGEKLSGVAITNSQLAIRMIQSVASRQQHSDIC
jgi:hydrogenase maturation protease